MIESTATAVGQRLAEFLEFVEKGESVRISSGGRVIARIIPDSEFITGKEAAALLANAKPDLATADAVASELKKLRAEANNALDH